MPPQKLCAPRHACRAWKIIGPGGPPSKLIFSHHWGNVCQILTYSESSLLDTVVRLESGVRDVWVRLTRKQPHAHLRMNNNEYGPKSGPITILPGGSCIYAHEKSGTWKFSNLSSFCDTLTLFLLSIAPGRHWRGHAVVVPVSSFRSLGCVAVELQLVAIIDNLSVPTHNIVSPVPKSIG